MATPHAGDPIAIRALQQAKSRKRPSWRIEAGGCFDTMREVVRTPCFVDHPFVFTPSSPPPAEPEALNASLTDSALLERATRARDALRTSIGARVVGQEDVLELMLIALLARGHALLVGVPGLAKTLLVSSLAEALDLRFGRVQFTPDLLPADITGTDVLQEESDEVRGTVRRVRFLPGPIFHHLILADEINRTPPKTQAALLQAMQERHVTVGNVTHALPNPFQVFATRNPIEQEGTYPLPEAQLDRFLLEIHVDYPTEAQEREIARRTTSADVGHVSRVLQLDEVLALQALVPRIPVTDAAVELAVALGRATRPVAPAGASAAHGNATASAASVLRSALKKSGGSAASVCEQVQAYVRFGAGPRGSQALVLAAKARAALRGEAAADIDDVRAVAVPVLRHRLVLSYRAEAEGVRDIDIVRAVVDHVAS